MDIVFSRISIYFFGYFCYFFDICYFWIYAGQEILVSSEEAVIYQVQFLRFQNCLKTQG